MRIFFPYQTEFVCVKSQKAKNLDLTLIDFNNHNPMLLLIL